MWRSLKEAQDRAVACAREEREGKPAPFHGIVLANSTA